MTTCQGLMMADMGTPAAPGYIGPPLLIFGMYNTSPYAEFLAGSSYTKMADPATLPATTLGALDRSPNGRWVAVGGATSPIKIYDMSSGAPVYSTSIALTSPNVTCIRFSPDSSKMLVQNNDTTVRIYDTSTWALTSFTAPASVYAIAWSADGSQFAIGMPSTPYLKLYDTATLAASATQPAVPPTTQITALAWSPDGSHLAVGAVTSFLIVYRTDTWAKIANPSTMPTSYPGAFSSNTMAWSPDSSRLAFVTPTTPYVWSYTRSGHTLTYEASPSVLPASPTAIVISADGGKAFVANGASSPNWIMTYLVPGWTRGTDPVSQGPATAMQCSIN